MILSGEEDVISPVEERSESKLCFYDVLADHYVRVPENGKSILDLIVQLWSQLFASHIFALLFHKWVCELAFSKLFDLCLWYGSFSFWPCIAACSDKIFFGWEHVVQVDAMSTYFSR